jgi:hypothetical protein
VSRIKLYSAASPKLKGKTVEVNCLQNLAHKEKLVRHRMFMEAETMQQLRRWDIHPWERRKYLDSS